MLSIICVLKNNYIQRLICTSSTYLKQTNTHKKRKYSAKFVEPPFKKVSLLLVALSLKCKSPNLGSLISWSKGACDLRDMWGFKSQTKWTEPEHSVDLFFRGFLSLTHMKERRGINHCSQPSGCIPWIMSAMCFGSTPSHLFKWADTKSKNLFHAENQQHILSVEWIH
jgi:hypothetical protein